MKASEKLANLKRTVESRYYTHSDAYVCKDCLLLARICGIYRRNTTHPFNGAICDAICDACGITEVTLYGISELRKPA